MISLRNAAAHWSTDSGVPVEMTHSFVAMYAPTSSGGHAKYCHELLAALAETSGAHGNSPVNVALVTSQDIDPRFRCGGYDIVDTLPRLKPRAEFSHPALWATSRTTHYLRRERQFLQWLTKNERCSAVHIQEYTPWLAPGHFRQMRRMGKSVFVTVHNIRPHRYPAALPHSVFDGWNRSAWRRSDQLFVHSEGLRQELSDFLGDGHPPIVVVPHGIWSTPNVAAGLHRPKTLDRKRLLFFGQLRRNKGIAVLLNALQYLPECDLTMAGSPETAGFRDEIRASAKAFPESRITLIDRFLDEDEVPGLFLSADLVILPYTSFAAQSGVLHDAIAWGLPVVASDLGAMGESIRNWGNGTVVTPSDASALARGIRETLTPSRYEAAREATLRMQHELSWKRSAEITSAAYLRCMSNG